MIEDFPERLENIEIKDDEGKLLFLYAYFLLGFRTIAKLSNATLVLILLFIVMFLKLS